MRLETEASLDAGTSGSGRQEEEDSDEEDGDEALNDLTPSIIKLARRTRKYVHLMLRNKTYPLTHSGLRVRISEIASSFNDTELHLLFQHYLYGEMNPNDRHSPEDMPLERCPSVDPRISVVSSATAIFFAPSDPSGATGRKREHLRATASWRNRASRYDTVLVKTGVAPGPRGLSVARLRLLFSFKHDGVVYPAALVEWFSYVGDSPDEDTGMWVVERETREDGSPLVDFICVNTILRSCHLLPLYGDKVLSRDITHDNSLDVFKTYYLNKYADHHSFEVLS
jgi:hypothetical protein